MEKQKYSQGPEELVIGACFPGMESGYLLDIGANDGETLSNTRALVERGWTGTFIEPDYEAFGKLAKLYAGKPGMTLLNAAVSLEGGIKPFNHGKDGGLCSSIEKNVWTPEYHTQEFKVVAVTPSDIVNLMPRGPDFINIDIEGKSFDVLTGFPIGSWLVRVICVEHDHRAEEIAAWGAERNYRVVELNAENIILKRR